MKRVITDNGKKYAVPFSYNMQELFFLALFFFALIPTSIILWGFLGAWSILLVACSIYTTIRYIQF